MDIKNIEQNRDSLIESLIAEEQELIKKIEKSRKDDDYGLYKNLIRALTDVTSLKQRELANLPKETWKDMFSHYWEGKELKSGENEYVATWQQKGDEIRKHKIYKIEKEVSTLKINLKVGHYEINNDTLTIPIQVGEKHSFDIKGKKVGDMWVLDNGNTIKCN